MNNKNMQTKFNKALELYQQNDIDRSISLFLELDSDENSNIDILYNLARLFLEKKDFDSAKHYYNKLLQIDENNIKARFDLSVVHLLQKDFYLGFKEYESRLLFNEYIIPYKIKYPKNINELKNKQILIFSEQGLGDTIQFIRFIPLIDSSNIDIVVPSSLLNILSNVFKEYNFITKITSSKVYEYSFPLLSIPYILGKKLKINSEKYLNLTVAKKNVLINQRRLNIGICWQGQQSNIRDKYRSIEFQSIKNIIPSNNENIQFYSLQKDIRIKDSQVIDLGVTFNDFIDTANAISSMDLIITVDTSIVHLSGALGKKTILLLPYLPDWRWGVDENKSYWYDSIKIIRQNKKLEWGNVFFELKYFLKKYYNFEYENIHDEIMYVLAQDKIISDKKLINSLYKRLVYLKPDFPELYIGLANNYIKLEKYKKAIETFKKAIVLKDGLYEAFYGLGISYSFLGKYDKAIDNYKIAVGLNSNFIEAINNLANLYQKKEEFSLAKDTYEKGMKINSKNSFLLENYASLLKDIKEYEKSKFFYEVALRVDPSSVTIHYNYGLLLILLGDYIKGWKEYSYYIFRDDFKDYYKNYDAPICYPNTLLENKTVLIVSEQGFGDNLMMIRFSKLLKEKFPSCTVKCVTFPELYKLFSTISDIDFLYKFNEELGNYDYVIPMMFFPYIFNIEKEEIPYSNKYFNIKKYKKLKLNKNKFNIGFVWSGSNSHKTNANRNLALDDFKNLFSNSECSFYSLQVGDESKKLKSLSNKNIYDLSPIINSFYDTAKIIQSLDLVITIDTSVAHLSASLGKETIVIVPYRGAFLWGTDEYKTPWYKSMNLFRIDKNNNIKNVFTDIEKKLQELKDNVLRLL